MDDFTLQVKLDMQSALKEIEGLQSSLSKVSKAGAPSTSAWKNYRDVASTATKTTTRLGRELDDLIKEYGHGSTQVKRFTDAQLKESKATKLIIDAKKRLLNLRRKEQITAEKARLEYERLVNQQQLFNNKMRMSTPIRQMQTDLNGVSNIISQINPRLGNMINLLQSIKSAGFINNANYDLMSSRDAVADRVKGMRIPGVGGTAISAELATPAVTGLGMAFGTAAASVGVFAGTMINAKKELDQTVPKFAAFEKNLIKVGVLTNTTGEDLENLSGDIRSLAAAFPEFNATDISNSMINLSKAGLSTKESLTFLEQAMLASIATGEDFQQVNDGLLGSLKAMGAGVEESSKFTGAMAFVANATSSDISTLAESIASAGSTADLAKEDIGNLTAITGLLQDKMIDAGTSGKAYTALLTRLSKPSVKASKELDKLGISLANADGNARPIVKVLREMADAMDGMGSVDKLRILSEVFGRQYGRQAVTLVENIEELEKLADGAVKASQDGGTAIQNMAEQMRRGLIGADKALMNSKEVADLAIGEQIAKFGELEESTRGAVKVFEEFDKAGNFNQIGENIGRFLQPLTSLKPALTGIGLEFRKLMSNLAGLFSPLSEILGVLGRISLDILTTGIKNLNTVLSPVTKAISLLIDGFKGIGSVIGVVMSNIANILADNPIVDFFNRSRKAVSAGQETLSKKLSEMVNNIQTFLQFMQTEPKKALEIIGTYVTGYSKAFSGKALEFFGTMIVKTSEFGRSILTSIASYLGNLPNAGLKAIEGLANGLIGGINKMLRVIQSSNIGKKILDMLFSGLPLSVQGFIMQAMGGAGSSSGIMQLKNVSFGNIENQLKGYVTGLIDKSSEFGQSMIAKGQGIQGEAAKQLAMANSRLSKDLEKIKEENKQQEEEDSSAGGRTGKTKTEKEKQEILTYQEESLDRIRDIDEKILEIDRRKLEIQKQLAQISEDYENTISNIDDKTREIGLEEKRIDLMLAREEITEEQAQAMKNNLEYSRLELEKQKELAEIEKERQEIALEKQNLALEYEKTALEESKKLSEILRLSDEIESIQQAINNTDDEKERAKLLDLLNQKQLSLNKKEAEYNKLTAQSAQNHEASLQGIEAKEKKVDTKTEEIRDRYADEEEGLRLTQELEAVNERNSETFGKTIMDAGKGLASDIFNALREGGDDVGKNILKALQNFGNKMMDKIMDTFLDGIFGGGSGASGGLFGSLGGLFGGGSGGGSFDIKGWSVSAGGTSQMFSSRAEAMEIADVFGGTANIVADVNGSLQTFDTNCAKSAKEMAGVGGAAGGLIGVFQQLIGGLGEAISSIGGSFGGGIGGALGGMGGFLGTASSFIAPIAGIGGAVAGVVGGFLGSSRKKKREKAIKEAKENVKKIMRGLERSFEALDKKLRNLTWAYEDAVAGIEKSINKLDTGKSIYALQEAIFKTNEMIDLTRQNQEDTLRTAREKIISMTRAHDSMVATAQSMNFYKGGEAYWSGAEELVVRVKEIANSLPETEREFRKQIEEYLDNIEEYIETQKEMIREFDREFETEKAGERFGDIGEDLYGQLVEYQDKVRELLESGFDPEKVTYLIQRQSMKIEQEFRETIISVSDRFADTVLGLNEELFDVLSEGKITGRVQKTQEDRLNDIRDRLKDAYDENQEQFGTFADKMTTAQDALDFFTQALVDSRQAIIGDVKAGVGALDNVQIQINDPKEIAKIVEQKMKLTGTYSTTLL